MNNDKTVIRALMYANACLLSAVEPGCPDLETAQRQSVAAMTHATEYLAGDPTPTLLGQRTRIHQLEEQVELREAARQDAELRAQAAEEDAREYGAALKVATERLIKIEAVLEKFKNCDFGMSTYAIREMGHGKFYAMTDEQIDAAVAEACPDKFRNEDDVWFFQCDADCWSQCHNNSICADLNAMHEAEKVLTDKQCVFFRHCLRERLENHPASLYIWHPTARQRAEAFLHALGK